MNIVFHGHHADVSSALQQRAEQRVRKLGGRIRRATDASIRAAADGRFRRIEIELRAPKARPLVAVAESDSYETALGDALARLEAQVEQLKAVRTKRIRQARANGAVGGVTTAVLAAGAVPGALGAEDDDDLVDLDELVDASDDAAPTA